MARDPGGRTAVGRGRDARATSPPARSGQGPPVPGRRSVLLAVGRSLLTAVGTLVLYFVLPLDRTFTTATVLWLVAGLLAVTVLLVWQVRGIMRSANPALRALESVALSLPLFLLLFAAVYVVLSTSDPNAFTEPLTRLDSLYFVVTVFATVGFGDITPVSDVARVLTTLQMVGDLVLIGLVLKIIVGAVDRGRRAAGR